MDTRRGSGILTTQVTGEKPVSHQEKVESWQITENEFRHVSCMRRAQGRRIQIQMYMQITACIQVLQEDTLALRID